MPRTLQQYSFLCLLLLATTLTACPSTLLNRRQLKGADPKSDLGASPLLKQLVKLGSKHLTIRGVKLKDTEKRVLSLWGRPSQTTLQSSIWKNDKGEIQAVLLWKTESRLKKVRKIGDKSPVQNVRVVAQLDLFPAAAVWLHPTNRALLQEDTVLSQLWRKTTLGAVGRESKGPFRLSYCYTGGICLSQFNDLAPQKQRQKVIFSLYPSS